MKYLLLTYGCQMNQYDSEVISSMMDSIGGEKTRSEEEAQVIIFNTCCVRKNADDKVYGRLGQYKSLKDRKKDLIIAVTGCLAQKDGDEMLKRFPHVDIVLGTQNLSRLPHLINSLTEMSEAEEILPRGMTGWTGAEFLKPHHPQNRVTAYIPVSIGCDCFCSYCIVPYVRGRLVSRPFEDIIVEGERLVGQGFSELFLLGQNVNTYGFDLPDTPTFTQLLKKINEIEGVRRIRFTAPHPKDFPPELTQVMSRLEHLCPQVHLPLQAGSDRVLTLMNRRYSTADYMKIVENLRKAIPDIALSTDLIVGFPGETEEDFQQGLNFIQEVGFDQAFMFAYSRRDGTTADKMPHHVPHQVKMERLYRLIEMQNNITRQKNEKWVGQTVEVLVESLSKKDPGKVTGRTPHNKVVNFNGNPDMIGKYFKVGLTKAYTWGFLGEE